MVDAYQIWADMLGFHDVLERSAIFCGQHMYGEDWVYCTLNRYGLVMLSQIGTPGGTLYVASRHLRGLLTDHTDPDGGFYRLRQLRQAIDSQLEKASQMSLDRQQLRSSLVQSLTQSAEANADADQSEHQLRVSCAEQHDSMQADQQRPNAEPPGKPGELSVRPGLLAGGA